MAHRIPGRSEVEDEVVEEAREDVEPFTFRGVVPEARADRVPADVKPGRDRVDESELAERTDWRTAHGTAVPGVGGGEVPPPEYGETPAIHPKRPLATEPPSGEVGTVPVPRGEDDLRR